MPFYTMPSEADLSCIAYKGLADNYLNELAAQLGKEPEQIDACIIKAVLKASLKDNIFTQVFKDSLDTPRAVFGMSVSGCVSFAETSGVDPMMRVKWARAHKLLFIMLRRATGLKPWCYSDSRNGKASRLLTWFSFKHIPEKDIIINGVPFYYYEHQLPVAESEAE